MPVMPRPSTPVLSRETFTRNIVAVIEADNRFSNVVTSADENTTIIGCVRVNAQRPHLISISTVGHANGFSVGILGEDDADLSALVSQAITQSERALSPEEPTEDKKDSVSEVNHLFWLVLDKLIESFRVPGALEITVAPISRIKRAITIKHLAFDLTATAEVTNKSRSSTIKISGDVALPEAKGLCRIIDNLSSLLNNLEPLLIARMIDEPATWPTPLTFMAP